MSTKRRATNTSLIMIACAGLAEPLAHAQQAPRITIDAQPTGARVYIDGKDNGVQCQGGNCRPRLSKGPHRLNIEMDGYKGLEETINVTGAQQRFVFALQPAPAHIELKTLETNTAAKGGEVYLDGTLSGTVPTSLEMTPGKHQIEVRRAGFSRYSESVDLKGGEAKTVYVALVAEKPEAPPAPAPVPAPPPPARRLPPPPPPAPGFAGFPVSLVARNGETAYFVATEARQSCTTPCRLPMYPGSHRLNIAGPGSNQFDQDIAVPAGPAEVRIQHFTTGRLAAGLVMLAVGIPLLSVGVAYYADPLSFPRAIQPSTPFEYQLGSGIMISGGLGLTIAGIATAASTKRNHVEVNSIGWMSATAPAPRPM